MSAQFQVASIKIGAALKSLFPNPSFSAPWVTCGSIGIWDTAIPAIQISITNKGIMITPLAALSDFATHQLEVLKDAAKSVGVAVSATVSGSVTISASVTVKVEASATLPGLHAAVNGTGAAVAQSVPSVAGVVAANAVVAAPSLSGILAGFKPKVQGFVVKLADLLASFSVTSLGAGHVDGGLASLNVKSVLISIDGVGFQVCAVLWRLCCA